jgi:hypothetical protein
MEIFAKFNNKNLAKLVEFTIKKIFSKIFPIYLWKISEISPGKKKPTDVVFCFLAKFADFSFPLCIVNQRYIYIILFYFCGEISPFCENYFEKRIFCDKLVLKKRNSHKNEENPKTFAKIITTVYTSERVLKIFLISYFEYHQI